MKVSLQGAPGRQVLNPCRRNLIRHLPPLRSRVRLQNLGSPLFVLSTDVPWVVSGDVDWHFALVGDLDGVLTGHGVERHRAAASFANGLGDTGDLAFSETDDVAWLAWRLGHDAPCCVIGAAYCGFRGH